MTYSEQLKLTSDLLGKIDIEEKTIKEELRVGKITREQAEEAMELPSQWQDYRYQLGVLHGMKAAQ